LLVSAAADDSFYGGVSASAAYESQRPAEAVSAEEKAAQEQAWRAELTKVTNSCTSKELILLLTLNPQSAVGKCEC